MDIQPDNERLARLAWIVTLTYADCDSPDRDEWLAYSAELAERFTFEE